MGSEQIRTHIAGLISDGTLAPGAKLWTVRQLAADLGVAANTVAKAYRQLESDQMITTDGRRGSFVSSPVLDGDTPAVDLRAAADQYATAARRHGLSLPEALRLVELAWTPDRAGPEPPTSRRQP